MDLKEAYALVQKNSAILIDIREKEELQESGIAEGALWMPSTKIVENHDDWLDFKDKLAKDKTIFMYCRSGNRVSRLAALLSAHGYKIENLGGLKDWQAAGLPVKPFHG